MLVKRKRNILTQLLTLLLQTNNFNASNTIDGTTASYKTTYSRTPRYCAISTCSISKISRGMMRVQEGIKNALIIYLLRKDLRITQHAVPAAEIRPSEELALELLLAKLSRGEALTEGTGRS